MNNFNRTNSLRRFVTRCALSCLLLLTAIVLNSCSEDDASEPVPTITSYTPESGLAGTDVTINGSNLESVISIYFGSVKGVPKSRTSSQIVVPVPAGATSGKIKLTYGAGNVQSTEEFIVEFKQVKVSDFEEEDIATVWGLSEDAGDISKSEFITADGNTYFHLKGEDLNNNYWVGGRYHGTGSMTTPLGVVEKDPSKVFLNFKIKNNNLVDGRPAMFKPAFYVYNEATESKVNWEQDIAITWSDWKVISIRIDKFHRWNNDKPGFDDFAGDISTVSEVALYLTGYGADNKPSSGASDFSIDDVIFSEGAALGQIINP